jgi:hypothetical protein
MSKVTVTPIGTHGSKDVRIFRFEPITLLQIAIQLGSKGVGSGEGKLGDLERTLSKIYPLPTLSLEGKNSNFAPTLSRSPKIGSEAFRWARAKVFNYNKTSVGRVIVFGCATR